MNEEILNKCIELKEMLDKYLEEYPSFETIRLYYEGYNLYTSLINYIKEWE